MSAKSRKPSRSEEKDDLFGAIPATPSFDAFPRDLIARLTAGPADAAEASPALSPAVPPVAASAAPPTAPFPQAPDSRKKADATVVSDSADGVSDLSVEPVSREPGADSHAGTDAPVRPPVPAREADMRGRQPEATAAPRQTARGIRHSAASVGSGPGSVGTGGPPRHSFPAHQADTRAQHARRSRRP